MQNAFGPFAFDRDRRVLTRDGVPTELGHRACILLATLLDAAGQPVTKSALLDAVWPDTTVEEGNLTVQIAGLRKLLGHGPTGQEWIVTLPRVGYRLILPQSAPHDPEAGSRPTLAVLPFSNISGDAGQDYFADGIVEDIIIALSRFRSFAVISRNSSFALRSRSVSAREAGRELGVRYVLEGSVRRFAERFRISAHLVDTETESNLWARNFDGSVADIFDVQDQITASVAAHVAPRIEQAEIERSRRKPPDNLDAYDFYLRALQKHNTYLEADNLEAIALLEQAITLAPNFGQALASAAYGYEHRITMSWPPAGPNDSARAMELSRAALLAAPDDATVLAHAGFVILALGRDYDLGLQTMTRAVEINPNSSLALMNVGVGNIWAGDLDLAMDMFHRAIALSPGQTSGALGGVAHVLLCKGRYDEALPWATRALAENPNFEVMHWLVTAALGHLGRTDEAVQALGTLLALTPGITILQIKQSNFARYPSRWSVILDGLRVAGMSEG